MGIKSSKLSYSAYPALALRSSMKIAEAVKMKHGLDAGDCSETGVGWTSDSCIASEVDFSIHRICLLLTWQYCCQPGTQ
jgi:hypothetical protein